MFQGMALHQSELTKGCHRNASHLISLSSIFDLYFIHLEITGDPCNLIGSQQCNLFQNRTISSANENGTLKRKNRSYFKTCYRENERQKKIIVANFATFVLNWIDKVLVLTKILYFID